MSNSACLLGNGIQSLIGFLSKGKIDAIISMT